MIAVRRERSGDGAAVRTVNLAAFETSTEADLVDALREEEAGYLGFVACDGEMVVGHVAFTPVTVADAPVRAMSLAPLAVLPARQRQGIGSALTLAGIDHLRAAGCALVVLVGHASYYPRFGFVPASRYGLTCPWPDVPDDVWLAALLEPGGVPSGGGAVGFAPAFRAVV